MKSISKIVIMAAGLSIPLTTLNAQEERPGRPPGGRPMPVMPLMAALDANSDGEIDASEISKASESLAKLDKNGDGKLTREELMPQRGPGGRPPGRPGGEGRGERGEGRPQRPQPPRQ